MYFGPEKYAPGESCCLILCCGLWEVRPTYRLSQWHKKNFSQDRSTLARFCKPIRSFKSETSFSAIGQHLWQNPKCAREYNDNKFSILSRGRTFFHLSTLEATYIQTKFMQTKRIRLWSKNHTLVSAPSIGRFFYQLWCSFFPFFLFSSTVSLYKWLTSPFHSISDGFSWKVSDENFENEYSTLRNFQILYHESTLTYSEITITIILNSK